MTEGGWKEKEQMVLQRIEQLYELTERLAEDVVELKVEIARLATTSDLTTKLEERVRQLETKTAINSTKLGLLIGAGGLAGGAVGAVSTILGG